MLLQEQLKKYVNAMLSYDSEAKDLRDAKKEFKASFMRETGAGKTELAFLDKAISINKKLETDHEKNDYVTFVEKVADLLARIAPGNENRDNDDGAENEDIEIGKPENVQMSISFNNGPEIETSTDSLHTLVNRLEKAEVEAEANISKLEKDSVKVLNAAKEFNRTGRILGKPDPDSSITSELQKVLLEREAKKNAEWNPPPGPVIPQDKTKVTKK